MENMVHEEGGTKKRDDEASRMRCYVGSGIKNPAERTYYVILLLLQLLLLFFFFFEFQRASKFVPLRVIMASREREIENLTQ